MFDSNYDGFPAVRLQKAAQMTTVQAFLRQKRISYRTKIVTRRRKPPEFIVMLVGIA
jgi:hypothetical protein